MSREQELIQRNNEYAFRIETLTKERDDLAHKLIAKQQMLVAREGECSAARENHLKVMKERDAAEQWRVEVAEALGYLNRVEGQSGYEVAGPRVIIAAFRRIEGERDAARENHLKVMKERDAAFSLLDSFRNAHVQEHRWGQVCSLCIAAQRMTEVKP